MSAQEPHTIFLWVGGCVGPCPTKWAAAHGPMRPHLLSCHHYLCSHTSAGTTSALPPPNPLLPASKQNTKKDSDMFNGWGFFPFVGLWGVLVSTEQVFQR